MDCCDSASIHCRSTFFLAELVSWGCTGVCQEREDHADVLPGNGFAFFGANLMVYFGLWYLWLVRKLKKMGNKGLSVQLSWVFENANFLVYFVFFVDL